MERQLAFCNKWQCQLKPFPHYRLFYHIIFTNNNFEPLDSKQQQEFRKKISSALYNKKMFELMLGAMLQLSWNWEDNFVKIIIDKTAYIEIENFPLSFELNKTYVEPKTPISDDIL